MSRSLFISFEGGEGGGKTTQINKLAETLTVAGRKVITTREPGGTPEAEKIRDLIVQREGGDWTPVAETLLLYAGRTEHIEKVIKPALAKGKIVISDRFSDSTIAYQGYGRGFSLEKIKAIQDIAIGTFQPDVTFILDIDPEKGLNRSTRRLAAEKLHVHQKEDRFENLDLDFHKRLRQGYLDIAKRDPTRCKIIDASRDVDVIAKEIEGIVLEKLG